MKTAAGLVAYCRQQLGKPYWFGTFGNTATAALYESKRQEYPAQYEDTDFTDQFGCRVHDCSGLVKGYFWSEGPDAEPEYASAGFPDLSANGIAEKCGASENMAAMPEEMGLLLFMPGHVGVYVGGGRVIEARGHRWGVVETALAERPWRRWGRCPGLKYGEDDHA